MISHFSWDSGLIAKSEVGSLKHPPHGPDPVPPDFCFFTPFKNVLSEKKFEDQNASQKNHAILDIPQKGTLL
jgi:hypothetical protein